VSKTLLLLVPLVALIGVTAMSHQPTECILTWQPKRELNLQNSDDRERLADELARIDTIAAHYREVIRSVPRESDSNDAIRTLPGRPDRAYHYCRAILREELAEAYGVSASEFQTIAH
jgi:hypothetical protein